jgi:uncharacterized protein YcgI (DUF1989 family)
MSLAAASVMDETVSLDLNGKLVRRLRLVRQAVVVARTGGADRLAAGQFLKVTGDSPSKPGHCLVFKEWSDSVVALFACRQEFNPFAGWYPTGQHAGIYAAT